MSTTAQALTPLLVYFVGPGAGVLASLLFTWLRECMPLDATASQPWRAALLYAPAYARLTNFALAALVSLVMTAPLAWLTGQDVLGALDLQLAVSLAVIAGQLKHATVLSTEPTIEKDS